MKLRIWWASVHIPIPPFISKAHLDKKSLNLSEMGSIESYGRGKNGSDEIRPLRHK